MGSLEEDYAVLKEDSIMVFFFRAAAVSVDRQEYIALLELAIADIEAEIDRTQAELIT